MPEDLTYLDPELLKWALKPGTDFHLDKDNALTVKQSPPKEEKVEGASKETPTPTADPRIPFSAYASMMAPPTGPSAAELRGLAPEQVMAVMDATGAAREAGRRTLADVEGWGLREAQRELIGAQMKKALRPPRPPAPPSEKQLRTKIYKRGDEWRVGWYNSKGDFVKDLRPATEKEIIGTVESGLSRERFEYTKQTTSARTRMTIRDDPESKEARDLVPTANKGSQDTTLMLWTGYGEWWGKEVKAFDLPIIEGRPMVADDIPEPMLQRLGTGQTIILRSPSGKVVKLRATKKLKIEVVK